MSNRTNAVIPRSSVASGVPVGALVYGRRSVAAISLPDGAVDRCQSVTRLRGTLNPAERVGRTDHDFAKCSARLASRLIGLGRHWWRNTLRTRGWVRNHRSPSSNLARPESTFQDPRSRFVTTRDRLMCNDVSRQSVAQFCAIVTSSSLPHDSMLKSQCAMPISTSSFMAQRYGGGMQAMPKVRTTYQAGRLPGVDRSDAARRGEVGQGEALGCRKPTPA